MLGVGRSSADLAFAHTVRLTGVVRMVDHTRRLTPDVSIETVVEASVID